VSSSFARVAERYTERDIRRVLELAQAPLDTPEVIAKILDNMDYQHDWRTNYRVQSVRSSLHAPAITCIDAAILSYGLLELLFSDVKRRLLAIHRRDQAGEECGHCVTLYFTDDGRVGTFSKSSFPGLGHRAPRLADEHAAALSYAEAYIAMGFEPLYFGVTTLESVAGDLDWRCGDEPLNAVSAGLQASYEYSFMLAR
jgi:hypothetical protein